jgi:hypothetical protein
VEHRCKYCNSENQNAFSAEVALHFHGLEGLKKPIVWVFPNISVCLNCGTAVFKTPEREMQVLRTGRLLDDAEPTEGEENGR